MISRTTKDYLAGRGSRVSGGTLSVWAYSLLAMSTSPPQPRLVEEFRSELGALGLRVKRLRIAAGLSQSELASRLGTTQSAVARLEAGRSEPRLRTLERLAEALDCDIAVHITGREPA